MKKRLAIIAVLAVAFNLFAFADNEGERMVLSLEDVISLARGGAIQAKQAGQVYEAGMLDYSAFLASRQWQLGLSINPNYEVSSMGPDVSSLSFPIGSSNALSAGATLDLNQLIAGTGGYMYASSNTAWSEYLGTNRQSFTDLYGSPRLFGTTPIRLGYRQELLGYNAAAWEKKVEEKRFETASKEYMSAMAEVKEKAAGYFFTYASARAMYDMYVVNAQSADSLYIIGTRKYELTAIRKDELLSLQLQLMNSQNSVRSSRKDMEQARQSLLSFIGLDENTEIDVVLPENPGYLSGIDIDKALDLARENNPVFGQAQQERISAEMEADKAERERKFQMDLDVSVGVQKYGGDLTSLGLKHDPYALANVTLAIPLVDHGMRRDRAKAAKVRLDYQQMQEKETERLVRESVINTVNEVVTLNQMLSETASAMSLADESFSLNQYNYAQGLSDINTFTLAQNRKDQAHVNYINALSDFWLAYYHLCSLTLYDFLNDAPLSF